MLRYTSIVASLVAAPAMAGLVQQQCDGAVSAANGSMASLKSAGLSFTLKLDYDANSASSNPTITDWVFTIVGAGGDVLQAKGSGRSAMTFSNVVVDGQSTRKYTMTLTNAVTQFSSLTGSASPTRFQFSFVARPDGAGGFESFGSSMNFAANATLGSLSVVSTAGGSFGMASTAGFSLVPAPGTAALTVAGLLNTRRRRAA